MKDLGAANKILRMKTHRNGRGWKIVPISEKYIKKVLERFDMLTYFQLSANLSSQIDEEEK